MRFRMTPPLIALAALCPALGAEADPVYPAPETAPVILYNWPGEDKPGGSSYAFSGISMYSTSSGDSGSSAIFGAGTEMKIGEHLTIRIEFGSEFGDRLNF